MLVHPSIVVKSGMLPTVAVVVEMPMATNMIIYQANMSILHSNTQSIVSLTYYTFGPFIRSTPVVYVVYNIYSNHMFFLRPIFAIQALKFFELQ